MRSNQTVTIVKESDLLTPQINYNTSSSTIQPLEEKIKATLE
jgi:hypothetical protein